MKALAALLLLLALPAAATKPPAHPPAAMAAEAHQRLARVLQAPEFGHEVRHMGLGLRRHGEQARRTPFQLPWWLRALSGMLGLLARALVAVLMIILVILVYRSRSRWLPVVRQLLPASTTPVQFESLAPESATAPLPADVAAAAEACWQAGDRRAALGLLYRGAVDRLDLPATATEGETLRLVRQRESKPVVEAFAQLVRAWQGIAYGQRQPADVAPLLDNFRRHFSRREAA